MNKNNFVQTGKITGVIFNDQNYEDKIELVMGDYEIKQEGDKVFAVKKNLCPFCEMKCNGNYLYENDSFFAVYDQYPVTKGHTLIISKRHTCGYFYGVYKDGLTKKEKLDLIDAIDRIQEYLSRQYITDDFNVGFNDGQYAGQTVPHFHCHIIPRYKGDTADPRGGVRGCVPEKMKY